MKKLIILPLLILALILGANSVFAVFNCGIQTPSSNTYIGNRTLINITFSGDNTYGQNATFNATATLFSLLSRNSSAVNIIKNITNHTATSINMTFNNSFVFDDANSYTLNCRCFAGNQSAACNSTVTGLVIDRTKPAAVTAVTFTNPVTDTKTITATMNINLARKCWIKLGGNRIAMTLSGSTCTYTATRGASSPPDGDYQMSIIADDFTNETASAEQSVTIDADQNGDGGWLGGGLQYTPSANQGLQGALGGGSPNPFAPKPTGLKSIPPLGWVVIAIAAVMLFGNNKKK